MNYMINNQFVASRLATFAKFEDSIDQDNLQLIINQLFVDLEAGHSCSKLSDLALNIAMDSAGVLDNLRQSGIVGVINFHNNDNLLNVNFNSGIFPLSIIKTNDDHLIYISKYLAYEVNIVKKIDQFNNAVLIQNNSNFTQCIDSLKQLSKDNGLPNMEQLNAIITSATQQLSIITGGPGTGKTTTVTLLLWLLYQLYGNDLQVMICAPTGKASSRVKESIISSISYLEQKKLDTACFNNLLTHDSFSTIHKLLGYIHQSIYFKHDANNPLDIDVLIVDESSMISLPLFSKLLSACDSKRIKHIIFLGDKHQLSSVEEGYVFASLLNIKLLSITELLISNRNQGDIGRLANAILLQNYVEINIIINTSTQIKLIPAKVSNLHHALFSDENSLFMQYLNFVAKLAVMHEINYTFESNSVNNEVVTDLALDNKDEIYSKLFKQFTTQSVLCLTNVGRLGAQNLNQYIEKHVKLHLAVRDEWYTGRPIIILENDYSLGLNNGDIGICMVNAGHVIVVFENGRECIPEILPKYSLAYAITVHKSQGSEYQHVNIVLAGNNDNGNAKDLLSRELIYTAITRAKKSIVIFGDTTVLEHAIAKETIRNTGIDIIKYHN